MEATVADTHFSGPVWSANGFYVGDGSAAAAGSLGGVGTNTAPYSMGTTADQKLFADYATTAAASGDTRLVYDKLFFTSTGSGETLRAFSNVTGANAATGGTVNGAHISLEVDGSGSVSGAGNALRVTLGGTATTQTGTLAAIQLDSNFASGVSVPATAAFLRVTDTNTITIPNFLSLPAPSTGTIFQAKSSAAVSHCIKINAAGTTYYIMVSATL
jgi:hypothetical protein